jgi:uncharacterized membrane protein YfcA
MRLSTPLRSPRNTRPVATYHPIAPESSAALWLHTPIIEVLSWAVAVFSVAWLGNAVFGFAWTSDRSLRIAFDLFALTSILAIMLASYRARGHWRRLHVLTLSSIAGDQFSALAIDSVRHASPEQLWALTLVAACAYGMFRLVSWMRARRSGDDDQRLARDMW